MAGRSVSRHRELDDPAHDRPTLSQSGFLAGIYTEMGLQQLWVFIC